MQNIIVHLGQEPQFKEIAVTYPDEARVVGFKV